MKTTKSAGSSDEDNSPQKMKISRDNFGEFALMNNSLNDIRDAHRIFNSVRVPQIRAFPAYTVGASADRFRMLNHRV